MADVNPKFPLVQFTFAAGIDEAQRAEVVDAGAGWLVLENGRQDQRGGYATRSGFTALSSVRFDATTATAAYKLFSDTQTPVRISDLQQVEAYSPQSGAWKQLGRVCEADYTTTDLPSVSASSSPEDVEYCNGYIAVVYQGNDGGLARVVLLDAETKAVVQTPTTIGVIRPMLASFSNRYIVATFTDTSRIQLYILDTVNAASIAAGWSLLATVGVDYANKDVAIHSLADRVAVAYINTSSGTDRVSVKTYDQTGLLQSTTVNTSSVYPTAVDVRAYPGGTLWVAWNVGTTVQMKGLSPTSLSTVLATTATLLPGIQLTILAISPSSATEGRLLAGVGVSVGTGFQVIGYQTSGGATAALGSQVNVPNVAFCSRAFLYNGRQYILAFGGAEAAVTVPITTAANTQKTLILVDVTDDLTYVRPVVNLTPGLAVNAYYGKSKIVAGATATTFYGVAGVTKSGVGNAASLITYDFASSRRWQVAVQGNTTILSGGVTSYFDGVRTAELGFLVRPSKPTTALASTGITGTNYLYVAVYEEVDADGNWCVSGLSSPSAPVSPSNQTVTVSTSPLAITQRASSLGPSFTSTRVAFYRTLTGGLAPYYRVGVSLNDTSATTVSFTDAVTDATLATSSKLYSQYGVLGTEQDRRAPPGLGLVTSYNGMLVGSVGSDVWYSGQNVAGEATWFNPIFQVPVPGAGDVIAFAVMDGTLFSFKKADVFAIAGDAPADNGSSGGLGLPRRLASDVGAISPITCTTALGVFFQSDRGIEILTRSQSVEWIGEAVQVTVENFPICTAMTVNPTTNTVLIELSADSAAGLVTGAGRTLVYDLSLNTWVSTDRRASSVGTIDAPAQSGCMIYTGSAWRYAWVTADGVVHVENPDNSFDADGNMVAKRAVSASVKGSGMLGVQYINRTQLLAKRRDSHDLTMSFAYDYSDTFTDARTWTAAELDAFTIANQQLEHGMGADAECEAVRVQIQDVTPSSGTLGNGRAATWIALCFEVVPKAGAYLLPDTSR